MGQGFAGFTVICVKPLMDVECFETLCCGLFQGKCAEIQAGQAFHRDI